VVQSIWQLEAVAEPTSTFVIANVVGGGFRLLPETRPAQPTRPKLAITTANDKTPERCCKVPSSEFPVSWPQAPGVFERGGKEVAWPESNSQSSRGTDSTIHVQQECESAITK